MSLVADMYYEQFRRGLESARSRITDQLTAALQSLQENAKRSAAVQAAMPEELRKS
jgi:hypothetical protein